MSDVFNVKLLLDAATEGAVRTECPRRAAGLSNLGPRQRATARVSPCLSTIPRGRSPRARVAAHPIVILISSRLDQRQNRSQPAKAACPGGTARRRFRDSEPRARRSSRRLASAFRRRTEATSRRTIPTQSLRTVRAPVSTRGAWKRTWQSGRIQKRPVPAGSPRSSSPPPSAPQTSKSRKKPHGCASPPSGWASCRTWRSPGPQADSLEARFLSVEDVM